MPVRSKLAPAGSVALFGGVRYAKEIRGWRVAWESHGKHRLWCHQTCGVPAHLVCVVMFNPGSLRGDGASLARDATLRIIRSALPDRAAALVLNLFTLAAPKPDDFFKGWAERDYARFALAPFRSMPIDAVVYAYGDVGQDSKRNRDFDCRTQVRARITEVKEALSTFRTVQTPKALITASKNPMHPSQWQRRKQIPTMRNAIRSCL